MSLISHAPIVHQGGGATLLKALLRAAAERDGDIIALLEERVPLDGGWAAQLKVYRVDGEIDVLSAEEYLGKVWPEKESATRKEGRVDQRRFMWKR